MSNVLNTLGTILAKIWAVPAVYFLSLAGYNVAPLTHPTPPVPIVRPAPDYSQDIYHLQTKVSALENKNALKDMNLGATNALPTSVAIFATSLQSPMTSSQTTMTLVSATYNNGASTIASSTYDFIIDEATASQEFVSADCTGVTCTNITRGLSWLNGTTSISALQFAHRRGASVKITDAPILLKLNWLANGGMGYPNPILYAGPSTTTIAQNRNNLASWGLVQDTAFSGAGAIKATTAATGYVQLATALQQASSTSTVGGNPLVIQSGNATSSCANAAFSALNVLVADNFGKLNGNCMPATITATTTYIAGAGVNFSTSTATTTNVGSFPIYSIGKNIQVFTTNGTFIPPKGVAKVHIKIWGCGGSGGGSNNANNVAGAGGGGGYAEKMFDVTATTSISVTVCTAVSGAAGGGVNNGTNGGTSAFGDVFATGGNGGGGGSGGGGAAGTGINGDINLIGGGGATGFGGSAISSNSPGGGGAMGFNFGGWGGQNNGAGGSTLAGLVTAEW